MKRKLVKKATKPVKGRRPCPEEIQDVGDTLGELLVDHLVKHQVGLAADLRDRLGALPYTSGVAFTGHDVEAAVELASPYVFDRLKHIIVRALAK